jgi:glycine/D-amino acid oxidase-like deaminating enzyme
MIVVGGGVIGTSVAWRLAQRGVEVTLVEAHGLASGTSSTSFAWLNANGKPPLAYHRLNWAGLVEHIRLREEFGSAPWLHMAGNLTWEQPAIERATEPAVPVRNERLNDRLRRLCEWNYPVEVLDRQQVAQRFPAITPPPGIECFATFPIEGWAEVTVLVGHLASRARALGATIISHDAVAGFTWSDGRITGVHTVAGRQLEADLVIVCAGRWSQEVLALLGITLPMAPTPGLLACTSPIATSHQSLVHSPLVNLRPDGGGRFLLANYDVDQELTGNESPADLRQRAESLLTAAMDILPDMQGATIEAVRLGIRSIPADGFPVVGPLPGHQGLYVVATHSGVTMGPLLGRLTADEVLDGLDSDLLSPFRPTRLVAG